MLIKDVGFYCATLLHSARYQESDVMSQQAGAASAKVEEYLEAIYNMAMEGEVVIGARLAEKFQVAPPSVTEMLKRLVRDGYIEMDERRQVRLTAQGQEIGRAHV